MLRIQQAFQLRKALPHFHPFLHPHPAHHTAPASGLHVIDALYADLNDLIPGVQRHEPLLPPALQSLLHAALYFFFTQGLDQVMQCLHLVALLQIVADPGGKDNHNILIQLSDLPCQLHAVHAGHLNIYKNHIEIPLRLIPKPEALPRLEGLHGDRSLLPPAPLVQIMHQQIPMRLFVLDHCDLHTPCTSSHTKPVLPCQIPLS